MAISLVLVLALAGCTPSSGRHRPVRVLVLGDSTGVFLTFALGQWNREGALDVNAGSLMGCPLVTTGTEFASGVERGFDRNCSGWPFLWLERIERFDPQVIVVASGFHDITDRRLTPGGPWESVGQPHYDNVVRYHVEFAARVLERSRARVLWLDTPPFGERDVAVGGVDRHPMNEPARAHHYNSLLREVVTRHPRQEVVPYAAFLGRMPGGVMNTVARPDGMHVDGPGREPVASWLALWILIAGSTVKP